MKITNIVDLQFGDCGKGRICDLLASDYDIICKYNGGPNSGRTVYYNDKKFVFRQVPSGAFHPNKKLIIGSACLLNLGVLWTEWNDLFCHHEINLAGRLFIDQNCHLIMPYHIEVDKIRESKNQSSIGTTKNGIGPCVEDKVGRRGIQLKDFHNRDSCFEKFWNNLEYWTTLYPELVKLNWNLEKYLDNIFYNKVLSSCAIGRISDFLYDESINNKNVSILCEGSQGTFLDLDHGNYPYVTSTNCLSGAASVSLGIPANCIETFGVFKAYQTRVGNGPFNGELIADSIEYKHLTEVGQEYGSVTGRPRRVAWLDLKALKKAIWMNGCAKLALTKLDILSELEKIKVLAINGEFVEYDGWTSKIGDCKNFSELPKNCQKFVEAIELELEMKLSIISVGPHKNQVIYR